MTKHKDDILRLRDEGKSYGEIQKELGCSKGTIAYHLGEDQKVKTLNRTKKHREQSPLIKKCDAFKNCKVKKNFLHRVNAEFKNSNQIFDYNYKDVLDKFNENPVCYLTGRPIDLNCPQTYHLDHIVPRCKGGDNSLENLGFTCKEANQAKSGLLLEDFISLCKDILEFQGYNVTKRPTQDSNPDLAL